MSSTECTVDDFGSFRRPGSRVILAAAMLVPRSQSELAAVPGTVAEARRVLPATMSALQLGCTDMVGLQPETIRALGLGQRCQFYLFFCLENIPVAFPIFKLSVKLKGKLTIHKGDLLEVSLPRFLIRGGIICVSWRLHAGPGTRRHSRRPATRSRAWPSSRPWCIATARRRRCWASAC